MAERARLSGRGAGRTAQSRTGPALVREERLRQEETRRQGEIRVEEDRAARTGANRPRVIRPRPSARPAEFVVDAPPVRRAGRGPVAAAATTQASAERTRRGAGRTGTTPGAFVYEAEVPNRSQRKQDGPTIVLTTLKEREKASKTYDVRSVSGKTVIKGPRPSKTEAREIAALARESGGTSKSSLRPAERPSTRPTIIGNRMWTRPPSQPLKEIRPARQLKVTLHPQVKKFGGDVVDLKVPAAVANGKVLGFSRYQSGQLFVIRRSTRADEDVSDLEHAVSSSSGSNK